MNKLLGSNLLLVIVIVICNACLLLLNRWYDRSSSRWFKCHKNVWYNRSKKEILEGNTCFYCDDNCDLHELKEWN